MIPQAQMILGYREIYEDDPPSDRIDIICGIPKTDLIAEFSGLNNRLKSKKALYIDHSLELQLELLEHYSPNNEIFSQIKKAFLNHSTPKAIKHLSDFPLLFTRPTCLFALEEITASDRLVDYNEDFVMGREENWVAFLKYIAAINTEITKINKEVEEKSSFEIFNVKTIALNELTIETDLFFTPYRGLSLIRFLSKDKEFVEEISNYFITKFGFEGDKYIYEILSMYYSNSSSDEKLNFYYLVGNDSIRFFNSLSERVKNEYPYKLINIRKNPFFKDFSHQNSFFLLDNMLLLEKSYSQFINDFWFDWLKPLKNKDTGKEKYNIKKYKSRIGYFFEDYLGKIFSDCFSYSKYNTLLLFDQLQFKVGKNKIEFADIYYRESNKILIAEAKSGNIYDTEKFSGELEKFYKNSRGKFFEDFGVNQLADSIIKINLIEKVDSKFRANNNKKIFPVIFVNDKIFQTPLMNNLFNERLSELLAGKIDCKKNQIYSLALIYIGDLELIWNSMKENPKLIWEILRKHSNNKGFVFPFYKVVYQMTRGKAKPDFVVDLYRELLDKYGSESV